MLSKKQNLQKVVDLSDPEWTPFWVNYKMLKKIIKELTPATPFAVTIAADGSPSIVDSTSHQDSEIEVDEPNSGASSVGSDGVSGDKTEVGGGNKEKNSASKGEAAWGEAGA